ncbi:hypothetical protein PsorP6_008114 [Peronosclerospora sorghi]|uniref:Uncharacterized protein n=1 Tax=Peronosclerospora sorghi TaxID=230839 RepID=A0ACC0W6V6_9STRA|nr:hypothetical protein PsorP6_008114 [Peronosclerospora sorghi]
MNEAVMNVEKVWIAEQKHAAEEKKVAELRKNIEEERQLQELRQLQAAQGNKSAVIERVDWMYEGPSSGREKTAEEFLLGREYKGEDEKAAQGDVDLSTTTKYGSLALNTSALPANDAFQRLNEDPMMLIRKRQQAARDEVLKNPVKMKKIQEKVDRLKADEKARKKAKKAAKKEKKQARREEKRLQKKKKRDDRESAEEEVEEKRKKYRHEDVDQNSKRSYSRPKKKSISPRRSNDHARPRSRHRERSPARRKHNAARDTFKSDRDAVKQTQEGSSSRTQRRSMLASTRRSSSRSRNSQQERDVFGRDRPRSRRIGGFGDRRSRSPSRMEPRWTKSRRNEDRRPKSRSRSPLERHSRRSSSCSPARRRKRRSRSPLKRQPRRHGRSPRARSRSSRSSSRRRKKQRDRSHSHSRSTGRHHSVSSDRNDEARGHSQPSNEPPSRHKPLDTDGKYGLISSAGAVESRHVDKTSLGPNAKFLAKAREAKRLEEEARQRKLGKSLRSESRELTDEEKRQLAQQMVQDAKQRDEYLAKCVTRKQQELDEREQETTSRNPEFLR